MSSGVRALLEYISELEHIVIQEMELPPDTDLKKVYEDWQTMCMDPGWESDPSSAPPGFWATLGDYKDEVK